MRIPSGTTDQYIYFYAVDATDFTTPETGLSTWTVYRSRNGAAAAAFTTPTVNETDSVNMAGVYELLLDEDMTIDAGDDEQEMVFHVSHAGMAPVVRTITLFRPKITGGYTLGVASDGDISGNVDGVVTLADGAHGGSAATITAKGITVAATDAGANAVTLTGQTTGAGLRVTGGASGHGLHASASGNTTYAIHAQASGASGNAIYAYSDAGPAVVCAGTTFGIYAFAGAGNGLQVVGTTGDIVGDITGNITGNLSGSVGSLTGHTVQTGDNYARLGAPAGASVSADVAAVKAETVLIVADTNELQGDWTNTGRLDTILDSILTDTGTTIPGTITTMQGNVTDIVADTNELQADWANGGRLDLIIDAILVDTGTTLPATLAGLNDLSAADVNAQVVDVVNVDTLADGKTMVEALEYIGAAAAGKISGAGTGTEVFVGMDGLTTRLTVTVDGSGNRSAITYG